MHTVKEIDYSRMPMFVDSNKLQNYENISSSDQSQVMTPIYY